MSYPIVVNKFGEVSYRSIVLGVVPEEIVKNLSQVETAIANRFYRRVSWCNSYFPFHKKEPVVYLKRNEVEVKFDELSVARYVMKKWKEARKPFPLEGTKGPHSLNLTTKGDELHITLKGGSRAGHTPGDYVLFLNYQGVINIGFSGDYRPAGLVKYDEVKIEDPTLFQFTISSLILGTIEDELCVELSSENLTVVEEWCSQFTFDTIPANGKINPMVSRSF